MDKWQLLWLRPFGLHLSLALMLWNTLFQTKARLRTLFSFGKVLQCFRRRKTADPHWIRKEKCSLLHSPSHHVAPHPKQAHKNVEEYYYPLSTTSPSHFAHTVSHLSPLSNHGCCSHHGGLKNFCNPAIRLKLKLGLSKGRKGICCMSWKKDSL